MNDQSAVDIEQFLEYLETSKTVDDVPLEEIEAAEKAYQEYLEGRDPGKSLVKLKAELGCGVTSS
ncbi:MAG: hypothetical protein RLZZ143_650 [Cyanobacteriota bacterium]|jgi:hypothetical protein|uniref:Uncharacterized protein n=1 Tax=Microcystis aeruginosa Ma_QC_C_20070703_M131 TaxID=2486263 RepID=A0A551XZU0_MICAE|nr:MAG: hypothetical protein EWV85_12030 [Microcystis aeruginosa Ma_QC_C_20070703_M131]